VFSEKERGTVNEQGGIKILCSKKILISLDENRLTTAVFRYRFFVLSTTLYTYSNGKSKSKLQFNCELQQRAGIQIQSSESDGGKSIRKSKHHITPNPKKTINPKKSAATTHNLFNYLK
jgi:hypothetical protein